MTDQILFIGEFILDSFLHIWPYLLITIPIAVAVNMSGASRYINRAFVARPFAAILLATAVGAFSPFCSCGVIPVVAALLIGGVPLAPVMAFWIASPSMDPEIFFLSVGMLGWELALWRLGATLVLSLSAGFVTQLLMQKGWLGSQILRERRTTAVRTTRQLLRDGWRAVKATTAVAFNLPDSIPSAASATMALTVPVTAVAVDPEDETCGSESCRKKPEPEESCDSGCEDGSCSTNSGSSCAIQPPTFRQRLLNETWSATRMVIQFMALAFFLEALILLFVPQEWIIGLLGTGNQWAIPAAALLGIPIYTSNLTALPLIGSLLSQGMNPAAALAFLIAGPVTTLPAMAAVWGLVQKRVFALYVSFGLIGSVLIGVVFEVVMG